MLEYIQHADGPGIVAVQNLGIGIVNRQNIMVCFFYAIRLDDLTINPFIVMGPLDN